MLFCLNLMCEHQAGTGGNVGGSTKTNESYTDTHFHNTMNRCELVIGHRVHVKHGDLMRGDLYSCLMVKLRLIDGDPLRISSKMELSSFYSDQRERRGDLSTVMLILYVEGRKPSQGKASNL